MDIFLCQTIIGENLRFQQLVFGRKSIKRMPGFCSKLVFPKIGGNSKSSILIGFAIINYKPSIWGYPPIFGNIHMAIYYGYDGDLIPSFNSWFTRHFRRYRILAQNLSHARPLEDSKFPFFSNKTKRTKDSKKNPSTRRNPRRPPYLQPSQGETC